MLKNAQTDYLTGFYTREALDAHLLDLIMVCKVRNEIFSIAVIDIDRFKKINDKFGHAYGDEVLKYVASTLRLTLHDHECYFFRYGGDELVLIMPGKEPEESFRILSRCNYNVRHRAFLLDSTMFTVTISCGVAGFPGDASTAKELIEKADKAMYFSKKHGFNLTTLAGRIRYIQLRNKFAVLLGIAVIVFSFYALAQQKFFKETIQTAALPLSQSGPAAKPKPESAPDVVVLKNGNTYEGNILSEDQDKVTLRLKLEVGEGMLTIPKSKIARIKYGVQPSPADQM